MNDISKIFDFLEAHEKKFNRSFSFIPSENALSPMARLAFMSDGFARYFFDEKEVFGRWSFEGGSIIGRVQQEVLVPLLRRVGKAAHVNLHPISGLTGMTLALAAFGGAPGNRVLSVPNSSGGHPDTPYVAAKLGYQVDPLPFAAWDTLDLDELRRQVAQRTPSLIYIDHATTLFPLDLREVIMAVRSAAPQPVHVHVDTSHVNGLIWGEQLQNPLECGADSYGGSTHKTFPGPHKAVLFVNDPALSERLILTAVNMISHHHIASVVALAISLVEFVECGGREYAAQIMANAKALAQALHEKGLGVQGEGRGFTANHQVWVAPPPQVDTYAASSRLFEAGLVVNPYNPLPSLGGPGIRLGVNEPTRLGLREADMEVLAGFFADLLLGRRPAARVAAEVAEFRRHRTPAFCYSEELVQSMWQRLSATFQDARKAFRGGPA